jgi:ADP-ribose pyrophosphatase YjhB (NUDIX family)
MIKVRVRLIIINQQQILLEHVTNEDFYFYPGGKMEKYETLEQTAIREVQEELAAQVTIKKILYIRDFVSQDQEEHSLEIFMLAKLDNYNIIKNPYDPDYKEHHEFIWCNVNQLPDNLYPMELTTKLQSDFQAGFPNQGEYLGALK